MKEIEVFNVEFDGIDKAGKDSIMHQIFAVAPNKYIPKSRGLLSQIAYSKLYNRDFVYKISEGYIQNTLFVLLTVDEEDWNVRCKLTGEHEKNKSRSDMEAGVVYSTNSEVFEFAYNYLLDIYGNKYSDHFMKFNTTETTPYNIITQVVERLEELNK
jgi:hypothetical protein